MSNWTIIIIIIIIIINNNIVIISSSIIVIWGAVFELCDWTRDYAASFSVVPGDHSPGRKLAGVWNWPPTPIKCRGLSLLELCLQFPLCFHENLYHTSHSM